MNIRESNWNNLKDKDFDITIIGGGINGASIFRELTKNGYKVFLLDKGDFSCGTSQASAMMIWGGLLYLKNLAFLSVFNYSKDRDKMITLFEKHISKKQFRYIANKKWGRNKYLVYFALLLYWMLGGLRRQKPRFQKSFDEINFINNENINDSLLYEEAFLKQSDSRFVLDWILNYQTKDCLAINYASIAKSIYNKKDNLWHLDIENTLNKEHISIKTKMILNCAGIRTDEVNKEFNITTNYKHVFSKGVFISYKRDENHTIPLIFEMGINGDTLTFIPWGPVSLWGPTETMEHSIDNIYKVNSNDISFLLEHANKNLKTNLAQSDIISLRCGVRPLVVKKTFQADCYPLDLSRNYKIIEDKQLPWMSIYGGKISGSISMAKKVRKKIMRTIKPSVYEIEYSWKDKDENAMTSFPNLKEKVPTIDWCVNNEFCCSLEDYLRRRTNIAQWIPREGLGKNNENLEYIKNLTLHLPEYKNKNKKDYLNEYTNKVQCEFDELLKKV